uniref:BHLH domain-containing protein n=1 Tax=Picea sitchensis TaxID=3332 RepID=A9NYK8_PICSI|nr:unknown [Picea sitchensis]
MASDCLFSYSFPASRTVYSNVAQCDRQVDCRVTSSRKRPSEVDLADSQDYNDLQEKVWRDVDRMMEFSSKESQTLAEQLRRKRMKSLCTQLESLLPATPAKLDRCGLFEETINYIRKLEENIHRLKRKRENLLAIQSGKTANENTEIKVAVEFYGREAIISITGQRGPRQMWKILEELESHGLDVETSQLFTGEFFVLVFFHVNFRDYISQDPAQIQTSLECRLKLTY